MASIVKRPNGLKWIQFNRKTLRLGKCSMRDAEKHKQIVENILASRASQQMIEPQVATFLGCLQDPIRSRYERCGLVGPKPQTASKITKLAEFVDGYFASQGQGTKPSTRTFWGHTRNCLVEHFGRDRDLSSITAEEARKFHVWLGTEGNRREKSTDEKGVAVKSGLSPNTVRRRIGVCRQIFKQAIQDGLLTQNPFAGMSATVRANKTRQAYIDLEMFALVLAKAPNARWRALLLLARIGAIRVPSEIQGMKWDHISWDAKRITIFSPKTEHHRGGESRIIPLFPAIEAELLKLYAEAPAGAEHVFPDVKANSNLRTTLEKMIAKAGLKQWPKLWQNLRASGATDLAKSQPAHVAAKICGHSIEVARENYWQVAESDMDSALEAYGPINEHPKQNTKQKDAAPSSNTSQCASGESQIPGKVAISQGKEEIQWAILAHGLCIERRENGDLSQPEAKAEAIRRLAFVASNLRPEQLVEWLLLGESLLDAQDQIGNTLTCAEKRTVRAL